jgi:hypothetical protein
MELVSVETKGETDLIADFMKSNRNLMQNKSHEQLTNFLFFFASCTELSNILTSLSSDGGGGFSWLSGLADFIPWSPGQPSGAGKCGGLASSGVAAVDCNAPSNFACEEAT